METEEQITEVAVFYMTCSETTDVTNTAQLPIFLHRTAVELDMWEKLLSLQTASAVAN